MAESRIQEEITLWLKAIGCKVIKIVSATESGNADLVLCYKGLYVEIEVKDTNEKARRLQLLKADETVEAGGYWAECDSLKHAQEFINLINIKEGFDGRSKTDNP